MGKLIIARHHESEWNKLGKWTGITDVDLTEYGMRMSQKMGALIKDIQIDRVFLSTQIRTEETLICMEKEGVCLDAPVVKNAALNERDYGDYTGKNKWEMEKLMGEEEFESIRRGWNHPVPNGETLKMVYERVIPYFTNTILPFLNAGETVIIVAHGNSLRALMKYIENISDEDIAKVEMLFGGIVIYDLDAEGHSLHKEIRQIESQVNA